MPVAKTFENCPLLCEPYVVHNHQYVKIEVNGRPTEVRFYNDEEYARMYPEYSPLTNPKIALGFTNGNITLLFGDTALYEDWFKNSVARYNKTFGWYIASTDRIPDNLPPGITTAELSWETICGEDGINLKNDTELLKIINSIKYGEGESVFVGHIGDRNVFNVKVIKAIPIDNQFGHSTIHIMEDDEGNQFTWTTGAKTLSVGNIYRLTGTIKDHKNFKGINQTVLTRCSIV